MPVWLIASGLYFMSACSHKEKKSCLAFAQPLVSRRQVSFLRILIPTTLFCYLWFFHSLYLLVAGGWFSSSFSSSCSSGCFSFQVGFVFFLPLVFSVCLSFVSRGSFWSGFVRFWLLEHQQFFTWFVDADISAA